MSIDKEFTYIRPKSLKRIHVGPMYSTAFTKHNDNIQKILLNAPVGKDWIFAWTVETILSKGTEIVKKSLFGDQVQEVYHVDRDNHVTFETGTTSLRQYMILPYEAFQILSEDVSNNLNNVSKYVVSDNGDIMYV
jgi:hypothetical protein